MAIVIENQDTQALVQIHNDAVFVARKAKAASQFKIAALIAAGALHDRIPGTAHFFEHLPFEKTAHFQDGGIHPFFVDRGGYINAYTNYDTTVYHASVLNKNFREGIYGVADLVCHPILEAHRVTREAQTITTEWAMGEMQQGRSRFRQFLRTTLGNHNPHPVVGFPESITSITVADLDSFYRAHYTMGNLIVYMQGDGDQKEMIDTAIEQFSLPPGNRNLLGPQYSFQSATSFVQLSHVVATHMAILFPSFTAGAAAKTNIGSQFSHLMLQAMDGPLMREARQEKRLVYGVTVGSDRNTRYGMDSIEVDAFPEKTPEICEVIMRQTSAMAETPDESLFDKLKKNRVANFTDYIAKNDENTPSDEARNIMLTHVVEARDTLLKNTIAATIDDVAAYMGEYYAQGPVAVLYEGKIDDRFPDHEALIAMRQPVRTMGTDKRAIPTAPDGKEPS
ncbi:MAG: pitrilysin family protein [Alphaproteobacteria bacterium]|nr:pitrilysin family protein [Alphaproteobacteria bacterium]